MSCPLPLRDAAQTGGVAAPGRCATRGLLGVRSGIGLVVANMIGAGVFLSAGFMAQDMGPLVIMGAWVFGAFLALCGVRTYGALARHVDTSGGEYRYLSDWLHPAVGYQAGWASLLLGFAAPVAIDAYAVGAFLNTLGPGLDPKLTGAFLIVVLTALHAVHMSWSKWGQNLLVIAKIGLVLGFLALGLAAGSHSLPAWSPPHGSEGFPLRAFFENQFWIAFAFSGWNAAIYAAGDFRSPSRDVPRAMLLGCGVVALLYLGVNWVFVANLTPAQAAAVMNHETTRVTLGHLVAAEILGPTGGRLMSVFAIVALTSSMSAMTLVGPRVTSAMARDGFLPRFLGRPDGTAPTGAVLLQGAVALVLLFTYTLLQAVQSASAVLMLFSALVALTLLRLRWRRPDLRVPRLDLAAAAVYLVSASAILVYGFQGSTRLMLTLAGVALLGLVAYLVTRRVRENRPVAADLSRAG